MKTFLLLLLFIALMIAGYWIAARLNTLLLPKSNDKNTLSFEHLNEIRSISSETSHH